MPQTGGGGCFFADAEAMPTLQSNVDKQVRNQSSSVSVFSVAEVICALQQSKIDRGSSHNAAAGATVLSHNQANSRAAMTGS